MLLEQYGPRAEAKHVEFSKISRDDIVVAKLASDDIESPSSLELVAGELKLLTDPHQMSQRWQLVNLVLSSGEVQIKSAPTEAFVLCRHPIDEAGRLLAQLSDLLEGTTDVALFEAQEPSFELNFTRSHHNGIKVEAWIDSGNAGTGYYRWDAAGVRFFTNDRLLLEFVAQLASEFGC